MSLWKTPTVDSGRINLATDRQLIEHGGTREGFIAFTLPAIGTIAVAHAKDVRQLIFECYDSFDRMYEIETHDLGSRAP
jgi:hypothetical protein